MHTWTSDESRAVFIQEEDTFDDAVANMLVECHFGIFSRVSICCVLNDLGDFCWASFVLLQREGERGFGDARKVGWCHY